MVIKSYSIKNKHQNRNILRTIAELKSVNAIATARVLEAQEKLLNQSVSVATSKNTRSTTNTPEDLLVYMKEKGVKEVLHQLIRARFLKILNLSSKKVSSIDVR